MVEDWEAGVKTRQVIRNLPGRCEARRLREQWPRKRGRYLQMAQRADGKLETV